MATNPIPANFPWVQARAKCSLLCVSKELRAGVIADVEARKAEQKPSESFEWSVTNVIEGRFAVVREDTGEMATVSGFQRGGGSASIDFVLSNDYIEVMGESASKFKASVTLNNEGLCKLKVGDLELDQWQVRRMALEELFFGPFEKKTLSRRGETLRNGTY
jgi:hypothetical protein